MTVEFFKSQLTRLVEQVKETLPDEIQFDWRKHLLPRFLPFLEWKDELRDPATRRADLSAGLLGAIIVLPQGIAFAMIAGLPPIYGLYSAMITPIVAALFGSSRHLVSGPTTAISIVIFGAVSKIAPEGSADYIEKVLLLTFLVGVIQFALGVGRLGKYVSFVSETVVVGFTAGAAILIMTNAIKGMLGLSIPAQASFLETWRQIFGHILAANETVLAVAVVTITTALLAKKCSTQIPYMLVGLAFGTVFAWAVNTPGNGLPFVGKIESALPPLSWPGFSPDNFHLLFSQAFAVALLGLISSVAISRSIAVKSGQQTDTNQEFIGQGLSNIVGSFFSNYVSSGSFTRSGLNFEAGARTPAAAIFSAIFLVLIMLLLAPFVQYLPMPAMSGLILIVGWNLIDFQHIREIQIASREDNIILGATFFCTLFFELQFAIYIGVLLSLFFFLKRTAQPNIAVMAPDKTHPRHQFMNIARKEVPQCPQVKIIRLDGSLYFGAIDHVTNVLRDIRRGPEKYLLLLANGVNHVDYDGAEWLAQEAAFWRKKGGGLFIVRLKLVAQEVMESGHYLDEIGRGHFFLSKTDALQTIYAQLDKDICRACRLRIFLECDGDATLPPVEDEDLQENPHRAANAPA